MNENLCVVIVTPGKCMGSQYIVMGSKQRLNSSSSALSSSWVLCKDSVGIDLDVHSCDVKGSIRL